MPEKVIIDGDWGSDEFQLASVLLAHPEQVEILGTTTVYGNTIRAKVNRNALRLLHFLGASHIPVYPGAAHPSNEASWGLDGAHGNSGIGKVKLDSSPTFLRRRQAVDFILQAIRENPGQITITASGPLTNLYHAFAQEPHTMRKVKQIIVMGGCLADLPAKDMSIRRGNITPHAEFNFHTAPHDAQIVLNSGLPITLLPMNCTQDISFTNERQQLLASTYQGNVAAMEKIRGLMLVPVKIDLKKFNSTPFMHDIHCALNLLYPDLYSYEEQLHHVVLNLHGETKGRTELTGEVGNIRVATGQKDPDKLFEIYVKSLQKCIPSHAA